MPNGHMPVAERIRRERGFVEPPPSFMGAWGEERARWLGKLEVATAKGETPVEPKGIFGLPLIPKGKSWLDNVFVRALHPVLGAIGGARELQAIWAENKKWGTVFQELPSDTAARMREQAEIALDEQARAKIMLDLYDSLPIIAADPKIASFEDFQEAFAFPVEMLSSEELQEARDSVERALSGSVGTELPDWLKVGEEEEAKIREFLEQPERELTPLSLSQMSVEEVRKALHTSPTAQPPPDMTPEEMLAFMSVMDLPPETLGAVVDIDAAVKVFRDAALEQQQMILDVKAGIKEWEPPDMSWWQKAFFMVQSPMQQFADFLRPYIENVSYPLAAHVVRMVNKFQEGTQDVEKFYDEARAKGMSPWAAAKESWMEWDVPWYQKLVIEIITDPITYVGTPIMTGAGKLLTRFGLGVLGRPLIAINKGFYIATDIPFDLFKSAMARFPKSTSQIVKKGVDDFNTTLMASVERQTGKLFTQASPDDLALTLRKAAEEYATNPKAAEYSLSAKLGEFMSEHTAMSGNKVWMWSRDHSGTLAKEFTTETIEAQAIHEVNQVLTLATSKQVDMKVAAAMLADSLGIERSPKALAKLMKDIPAYTKSLSTSIDNALRVGQSATINKVARMLDYLNKRQKAIIASREAGKHAKGGVMEGIALGLQRNVDRLQNHRVRMAVERWVVRPFAEGNLGSISYPFWNAFEGIAVSIAEGVIPRTTRTESYLMMTKALKGDAALASRVASDVAGILGGAPHRMGGAWTFFPRWKVPERFAGIGVPKFIAGREFMGWFGRKWIDLSNTLGNAYRQNFVMQRMSKHLAEIAYKEAGGDVMEGLRRVIGHSPKVSKQTLGMSAQDLESEVWRRMTVSSDDVLDLHRIFTDGVLQQEEMLKILRTCDHLSPRAKTLGEQLIMEGKVLRSEDDIARFAKKVSDTALEDLRQYPFEVGASFRSLAGEIDTMPINTTDELMEVFTTHEVMSQTASYVPHRIMSQTMDEAAELYERGAWRKLEQLWRTRREQMLTVMDEVTGSMGLVRAKLIAGESLLTVKQRAALESVLERAGSADILRGATLQSDAVLLDSFWKLPRASRTAEAHSELRLARAELWVNYRSDLASIQAAEFVTRRDLAALYHNLPEPKLTPVDASARALSTQDVAHVFGTNVDGLATGTLESVAVHGREYFIQLVKQSADSKPHLFKGFTEEKIGQVFDNLLAQAKMTADQDIMMQKILQQSEGMRQGLLSLKMRHSLLPDESKALRQWIDNAAAARDKIIVKAPKELTPEQAVKQGYIVRGKGETVWPAAGGVEGTWFTSNVKYARTYGKELSFVKRPEKLRAYATHNDLLADMGKRVGDMPTQNDYYAVMRQLQKEGYEGLSFPSQVSKGADDIWLFKRPDLVPEAELGKLPLAKGQVSQTKWDELRQEALNRANKDYYKAFADYTNENVVAATMKTIYPYWCIPGAYKIMTRTGWKHYSELVIGESVLTVNPHTLVTEWEPLEEIAVFDYDGELMSLPYRDKDILFTKDHRWLTITPRSSTPKIKRGYELTEGYDLVPRALPHVFPMEVESILQPREAAILGWVVTDGATRGNQMYIYQSETKYFDEVMQLTGGIPRQDHRGDESNWVIRLQDEDSEIIRKVLSRYSLIEIVGLLSRASTRAMWDAMFKAEGNNDQGWLRFKQKPGKVSEAFQLLSILLGKGISVSPSTSGCETTYIINNKKPFQGKQMRRLGAEHYKGKIWCPRTPNGTWIMNAEGKVLPTGNTYHTYRWFYMARLAIRHPGTAAAWGKYQNYGQYGYQPTPIPDIEMNPFVGSMAGTTFGLTRFDFAYYYSELGFFGEMLDYSQRWGFYPGAHIMFPISLTPYLVGRKMELSEVLPPVARSTLNFFVASPIPAVAKAAQGLKDKIFHENFHLYYTASLLTSKQVEAGGTLIGGQSGSDIWMKLQRGEKLTDEEQRLWDESYQLAAKYGLLRAQFPQFRLRTEEYKEAYDAVTQIFKEEFGMSEEYQKELWRHHIQPTDVVGGLPLDVRNNLDELWQWKLFFGRGTILMPPDVSDLRVLQDKYYKRVESYQKERLEAQGETDLSFMSPTLELHLSGHDWRAKYAENWSSYITKVEGLEEEPEFADAIEAMTPEGRMRIAERLGWNIPPVTPMEEAIQLYFDIELEKSTDPYTGETYDDYLSFWMKREAVRMALTEEQRTEFDRYIRKYQTPMEKCFKYAYNTYIRGYRATSRIVFESYSDEQKTLIREFYSDVTTSSRKIEIREVVSPTGRKLISEYESKSSKARIALRQLSPTLDFWLLTFGYVTKARSPEAQTMFDTFESDRSSILKFAGIEVLALEPQQTSDLSAILGEE